MRRRNLVLSGVAAGASAAAGATIAAEPASSPEVGRTFQVNPVPLPIVVDGRLRNYVFTTIEVRITARAELTRMQLKEPYIRDALLKAGHATPFTSPGDLTAIDEAALSRVMLQKARAIAGPGLIASIRVVKQSPQRGRRA